MNPSVDILPEAASIDVAAVSAFDAVPFACSETWQPAMEIAMYQATLEMLYSNTVGD